MEGTGNKIRFTEFRVSVVGPKEVLGLEVVEEDCCPRAESGRQPPASPVAGPAPGRLLV
jgi:hypothetical protein